MEPNPVKQDGRGEIGIYILEYHPGGHCLSEKNGETEFVWCDATNREQWWILECTAPDKCQYRKRIPLRYEISVTPIASSGEPLPQTIEELDKKQALYYGQVLSRMNPHYCLSAYLLTRIKLHYCHTTGDKVNASLADNLEEFILLENGVLRVQGNPAYCVNDTAVIRCIPEEVK